MTREGPFWDVMAGRAAPPPAATMLGWELVAIDPEAGTIEVAFTPGERAGSLPATAVHDLAERPPVGLADRA
jgi:hypothetical protein